MIMFFVVCGERGSLLSHTNPKEALLMGKMLKNVLRTAFVSFLFVSVFLTPANAYENCPSNNGMLGTFQEMSSDLTAQGYHLTFIPSICSTVIEVIKKGESLNHGLAKITWQITTRATVHYVWTGKQYQFIHFGKLQTESEAPLGVGSRDSTSPESLAQERQIYALFTIKYRIVKNN